MRTAAVAGILGGLSWVGSLWLDPLLWAGAALLAVAVLAAGSGLVSRSAVWLRVIVGVCFLALVVSVLEVLRENVDDTIVLAASGVLAVVVGIVALSRRPAPEAGARARTRGAHAA